MVARDVDLKKISGELRIGIDAGSKTVKGHVQSRGAAHELMARYPGMPITIVDYDADSSALNCENRMQLAAEAAKRHDVARPVRLMPNTRSSRVDSLEGALRESAKQAPDATTSGKAGNTGGKIFFDTTHRRIVSLLPLEEIGGENRLLVEMLLEEGYRFELDLSPRYVAKGRESLRR